MGKPRQDRAPGIELTAPAVFDLGHAGRVKRLLLLVVVLLALPTTASAHGDTGILEVVSAELAGDTAVRYVVRLTYENDGDLVSSADVRVVTGGTEPVTMAIDGDGLYSATVTFPDAGEHAVRFESDEPTATLEHLQVVTATTTADDAPDAPNVAEAPLPDDAEGGSAWLLVLMTIIVVVMVVLAIAFVRGRRPPA